MTRLLPLAAALLVTGCATPSAPRIVTGEDADVARIAEENNAFTWDMHRKVAASKAGNAFHSPFSMNAALSMTYAGAKGETAAEMERVLHMEAEADRHGPMGALIQDLNGDQGRDYTLHIANRIWGEQSVAWESSFLSVTESDYAAPTQLVDIAGNPDGIREEVNDWAAEQTEDKIRDLLPPGSITGATRMILANAIYFKADWATQFEKSRTRTADFYVGADGSAVDVDMMNGTMDVRYGAGDGFSVAGLAYGESADVRMWIVLPEAVDGLESIESLEYDVIASAIETSSEQEVELALPKVEMRTEVQLEPALTDLGMPTAFTGGADFSGMADLGLFIDEVYHQAYVKIDEEGTEAAAATAVVMNEDSSSGPQRFTVDRPYLFLIRDELSGAVLFIGRVTDPSVGDEAPL